jgi:hypothetical protein
VETAIRRAVCGAAAGSVGVAELSAHPEIHRSVGTGCACLEVDEEVQVLKTMIAICDKHKAEEGWV